jgi:hypothetical protein
MSLKRRIFTIRKLLEIRNKLPEGDYRKDFTISKLLKNRNKLAEEDYWKDFHN